MAVGGSPTICVEPSPNDQAYAIGRATTVTSKPRSDTAAVVGGRASLQKNVVNRAMPGQSRVPGGLAPMPRRGRGVCSQISAAVGASQGGALPGVGHHGTMIEVTTARGRCSEVPDEWADDSGIGGSNERSSSSHALDWSPGSPNSGIGLPLTEPFGRGVTCVAIACGQGPANTTQYRASFARDHVYGDFHDGSRAGSPPPGKVPAPRSPADART